MPWVQSFEIPPVKHNAPIPMAARAGNILYTSGIMGADPDTGQLPPTVEEQARNCFRNLRTVLEKAGAKTTDVVKLTVYIKSNNNRQAVNPAWLEMFPDEHSRPARHQTVVETLNFDIQIEAMAVIQGA
ncbi:MAG TPA: RidA family protein [Dehalococcoidia bacterium]|nr:RidA family protein [Dehalococcoidia bacterium]